MSAVSGEMDVDTQTLRRDLQGLASDLKWSGAGTYCNNPSVTGTSAAG